MIPAPPTFPSAEVMLTFGMYISMFSSWSDVVNFRSRATVGLEKDEDAYVVLKELPTLEMMQLNEAHEKGRKELLEFFVEVLPLIIVEHNLYETELERS